MSSSLAMITFRNLCMMPDHAKVIDEYCSYSRSDVHSMKTFASVTNSRITQCFEILSLYLHEENHDEVARQHLHMAKTVSGGDHSRTRSIQHVTTLERMI